MTLSSEVDYQKEEYGPVLKKVYVLQNSPIDAVGKVFVSKEKAENSCSEEEWVVERDLE